MVDHRGHQTAMARVHHRAPPASELCHTMLRRPPAHAIASSIVVTCHHEREDYPQRGSVSMNGVG